MLVTIVFNVVRSIISVTCIIFRALAVRTASPRYMYPSPSRSNNKSRMDKLQVPLGAIQGTRRRNLLPWRLREGGAVVPVSWAARE
eukprot:COSAG02_NODE_99_length_37069_cov_24.910957_30_plen_86_part_00